ncbi:intermembrane lipid transfer protein VPS13A-like [Physella acuta]|uniref:intermembrane lipid transfer protein VPS13A-like n=1 Tax=Physella acuta TaxID=109671 RepID=UPI0027DDD060|nr:intermembrane lipid transfer protein VPS13A-like [Physella acuta]
MVFETIAVELINRYLGTFVENLDTSQLKIGLWGGDVVLNKLNLKENALDDMDLPIKIKAGHIEKLTLKIPWKNLYSEAVVAQIEGVYALVVPNIGITYDAAKEFKAKQELKQAILTKIDEQKKLEAEKDKPKEVKNDSFVEKLATQVIKNLQIKVSLIHIRYEDKYSNPARPVSMGITLNELLFQTTDSNWKEMIIKEAVTQIYKLVRLDSLCVYWNSNGKLLQDLDKKLILQELHECIQTTLKDNIAKQGMKPNLQYLFKPISAVAHLRLNTKPEQTDFSLPKIFLTLVFDEIAVSLSKDQYDDILEILEAMERMNLMAMYKKTRPAVSYKGHAKQWWHHAYAVILEHNVQRRRKMWNWNVMKEHRDKLKLYRELYKQKLENKKMSYKDQGLLKQCEEDLDVFNISMCRNQAEMDVIKRGKKRDEEKSQASWFGGWFAPSKKKASPTKKPGSEKDLEDFGNKFQEGFTPEEKNKLYNAIGYDENAKDPTFPIEYVAVRLVTKLNKLSVSLVDNRHKKDDHQVQLMKLSLTEICASFGQRPAANAVRLDAKVDKLRITGLPRKEYIPRIVSSVGVSKEENVSLLTILFETNPLDGQCDSRVRVQFRPLEIIFDAITVNALSSFFMPPESVRLKQLSNAAMSKYDDIKAQTSAGVMYMVNQRKYADIDIHLMPSYIIVPETGEIKKDVNMILLNLGQLKVTSQPHEITQGKQMSPEEMVNFAFDKFIINLDNLQLLFLQPGDVWHDESVAPHSPMYILRPLSLRLLLEKCIFDNDANLPKIRISAELPLLSVYMSDTKLLAIMKLASSIPLPESGSELLAIMKLASSIPLPESGSELLAIMKLASSIPLPESGSELLAIMKLASSIPLPESGSELLAIMKLASSIPLPESGSELLAIMKLASSIPLPESGSELLAIMKLASSIPLPESGSELLAIMKLASSIPLPESGSELLAIMKLASSIPLPESGSELLAIMKLASSIPLPESGSELLAIMKLASSIPLPESGSELLAIMKLASSIPLPESGSELLAIMKLASSIPLPESGSELLAIMKLASSIPLPESGSELLAIMKLASSIPLPESGSELLAIMKLASSIPLPESGSELLAIMKLASSIPLPESGSELLAIMKLASSIPLPESGSELLAIMKLASSIPLPESGSELLAIMKLASSIPLPESGSELLAIMKLASSIPLPESGSEYMSDTKLLAIMKLASSIPLPESGSEVKSTVPADDAVVVDSPYDMDLSVSSMRGDRGTYQGSEYTNQTQLMLSFMLKQISVEILETVEEKDIPFLKLTVNKIGVDMKARTFDLTVDGYLGGIYLQHMQYKVSEGIRTQLQKCEVTTGELINIINSPYVDEDDPLLSIHFLQANKKGPEFATTYGKIAQSITVEFSTLDLVLHQGVILSLLAFAQKFESPEEAVIKPIVTPVRSIAGSSTTLSVRNKESLVERQIKKDKMDMMLLKFRAIVNSIQLSICNETCLVMHSKIEGVEVGAKMHVHKMGVSALMRKIELLDPDPRTKYPKIFSVSGEEMFKFEMVQYNHGTAGHRFDNISAIDMDIFLQLGKAQLVFVNKFVLSLLNFLDNFNLAKAKLDEASQAVKEASLDVAKNFQEKAPRIKLEISLKAPLLVIPKSSRSKLALIINLGDINLVNKFEKLYSKTKTVPGQAHIVEHLVVMLTNLQFCRGSINNLTSELYWELPIIEPLTFQVNIHRNLSSGWFHGIPDMEIAALLDKISIKLNKEDISLMLSILVGNLKEQNPQDPTTLKIEKPSKEARSTDHALRKKAERGSTDSQASAKSDTLGEEIYSTLKVDFKLQAINVELYRGRCKADEGEKVRPKSKMLSQMCLTTLLTEVNMMSDESMSAKVGLVDFRMDDCRIEKDGGITKLIRRTAYKYASKEVLESQTSEDESKMFINIHYDLNKTMDKKVVFKICSLHICICMEFIMKVVDFFVNSMPSIKTNEKQMIVKKTHPKSEAPVPPPPPEPFVGSMDVTFKLEKPEIYLIEDQMNPHTNSMIVDVKLDFRLRMSADVISVQGSVENLSLVTCIFGQLETRQSIFKRRIISSLEKQLLEICYNYYEHRWDRLPYLFYVLEPVNITLMSNSPQGKDHHVNVNVSDFIVTISPSTIRLLSTIATNMAVQSLDDETDLLKLKDMSNIWAKSSIAEKNFWFINAVQAHADKNKEIGSSVDSGVPATVLNDTLSTSSRGELVTLENLTILLYKQDVVLELMVAYADFLYHEILDQFLPLLTNTGVSQPQSSCSAQNNWPKPDEQIILEIPVVVMKLEGGVGHRTVPLLIVESSFECQVHNWSSDLFFESSLSMEVAYNNEHIGVWEPILEPVTAKGKQPHKWELSVEMVKSEQVTIHDEEDMSILPPPKLTINIAAIEPLQIIMTKSCLEVLSNLGEAFGQAYNLKEMEGTLGQKIVPYVFQNLSGKDLGIQLDASLKLSSENEHSNLDKIPTFTSIMVDNNEKTLVKQLSIIRSTQQQQDKRVIFFISGQQKNKKHETSIKQARKSVFVFDNWNIMVNVDSHIGQKTITFSSCIQIMNHMCVGMELFYVDSHDKVSCGVVKPDSTFYLPLNVVYSHGRTIFFKPKQLEESSGSIACNYDVSQSGVSLDVMPTEPGKVKEIHCSCSTAPNQSFYFNVMPEQEKIFTNNTEDKTSTMTIFHIKPTVIIHNQLPLNITYSLDLTNQFPKADAGSVQELPSGQLLELHNAAVNTTTLNLQPPLDLMIPNYRGFTWKGKKIIKLDVPELSVWTFESSDNDNKIYMDLGLHCKEKNGSFDMTIYCPYWIINLSTRTIALKEDDKEAPFVQQGTDDSIMLFYFRDKPLFGSNKRKESTGEKKKEKVKELKKPGKVMLKVADSEWSDKFSLDTVGTGGSVSCKHKAAGNVSEVGLSIQLTSSGLTKIVTFTPFYLFLNLATIPLCIQEVGFDVITVVQPEECKAFYPKSSGKEMKIQVKPEDGELFTAPFFLNKAHSTLLKLEDKYGGIQAECQVSESSMITTLKIYMKGMATVMFVNHTSQCNILVRQSGSKEVEMTLEPQTTQLYTWNNPTGNREILWTCGNKKDAKNSLDRDHIEEFFAENDVKVYFVSFLDGLQRVAMFTQDLALATLAQEAGELEQADQEINLKIHDMGFSLINNKKMVEVAYMGITSSGVIWEEKKKKYKAMKLKDTIVLETAYQKYLMDVEMGKSREAVAMLENKLEVDFTNMMLIKPKACGLRRSFENGIWVQVRTSPHSMQFHAKINRLQFDNQLRHAVFPTVLSPLPPPKSVAADSVPKPFIEVSLMNRIHEHSNLVQIKYFKVLIQEMNLKVDQGFLMEILDLFSSDAQPKRDQEEIYFKTDIDCTKMNLKEVAGVSIQAQRVSFYDYFHVSPIKIHISFSIQGGSQSNSYQANILGVFLQSVGVVLTDVQDVVFKLGFFERNHSFYTKTQLTSEFVRHYSGQAVKQMYVLVLGLDVLGNPFGLLRGLSEGIEDLFYEPYQGAIQGPEEFAEGLALGVRSLFGHAVGGTAGAVSRITGTLGKGLAALTLDEDYQKKRREQLNKRPATAREGFARGGKGLVMGVFDGVTGIVRKPVEGAKQEGFTGFFKGVGKGLVGVVTRPTSGVVDFASSSLEGIRRITDMSDEIHRLRPPRRFNKDGIIRPYIQEEAEGYNLLLETDKGKYVDSDEYVQHYKMKEDGKIVFIITDKRIMLAKRGELFGSWDTEWVFTFQELKAAPKLSAKGIEILLKDKEKKKLFGSNVTKKDLIIADAAAAQIILTKIIETMESERVESGV